MANAQVPEIYGEYIFYQQNSGTLDPKGQRLYTPVFCLHLAMC